ncbi:ferric-chelate reductase [Galdieria sulphuraria]|uniref:Ferric-chelate reductase n=1 Tax=Galdieria sulphuraria TaxID=130081 RepID=M2VX96_GALSU|nr:ferric-chelate reductase [Galdieria sulphuraria]EME27861.1 ferric-chelate reductase [Galdieria sulphuraria]|eukprot:XP_005704381.1 ferric-chelate reductase [Galdieria sulphuraria]
MLAPFSSSPHVFLVIFVSLCCLVTGHLNYLDQFPNGAKVLDPQSNTTSWIGVGHKDAMGTTGINQFGKDFRKVGGNWKRLCVLDSDGDGQSNGMELGDPCCVWKKGDIPFRVWDISHPGTRSSITKAKRPVCPGETVLSRTLASLYRLGLEESVLPFYMFCTILVLYSVIFNRVSACKYGSLLSSFQRVCRKKLANVMSPVFKGNRFVSETILYIIDSRVAIYLIFQAYFCRYLYFQKYISLKSPLTRCAGELAVCNLGILLFPVSRNSPLWSIMGTCFERTLLYHRLLGYWTLFLTSWHAFGMFHSYMFQSRGFAFLFSFSSTHVRFNLPGIFAHLFLLLLGVLALHRIRRKAFEVFYYSHVILFPFCLIFTVLHIGFAAYYLAPGLLSLGIDYMLRIYRTYEVIPLKIRVFQDAVRITLVGPREWTTEGIGGHLGFFKVPHLAWLQSHPFSIFSLDSNTFDIIVRRGMTRSFTDKLYKACQGYSLFYNNDELVEELQFANGRMLGENDRNISTVSWLSVEKDISSKSILRVDSKQLPQMPRITCFYGLKKEFIQYLLQLTFSRVGSANHSLSEIALSNDHVSFETGNFLCSSSRSNIWPSCYNMVNECTSLVRQDVSLRISVYDSLVRNNENSTEPLVSLTPDNILGSNFFRHDKQGLDCYIENGYKRLEEGCKVSLNEMIIQVQGPYGSLPVNPFHFSSILLCAGGVGITGILSILCDIYQHSKRNIFEDITLCWTISNTAHFEWVQDVLFSIQEDHLLKYVVHYEIYITNGDFPCLIDSSFSQTIHFYRGRPDWNTVICNWRHESLLLGIHKGISYICGPPSMVSQVQEHCRLLENDNWSCTTSTETFEF